MEQALEGGDTLHRVKRGRPAKVAAVELPAVAPVEVTRQQGHALRIWNGQSVDVPVVERVRRIVAGLTEQGLPLDITLPHPDAARYLNAH